MGKSFKELKLAKKLAKKVYKKARRKHVSGWKFLAIFSTVVAILGSVLGPVFTLFDNTLAAFVGGTFTDYNGTYDENAIYFNYMDDFESKDPLKSKLEMIEKGNALCEQVEAEGATLLVNKNNALPLEKGSKVSTLSSSSVDLVYGGTGSAQVDTRTVQKFDSCLTDSGLVVNDVLWDFYMNDAAEYRRTNNTEKGESAALMGHAYISEVPMDKYPDEVKQSIVEFGDAAIITFSRVGGEGYDLKEDLHSQDEEAYNYLALSQEEKDLLAYATELKRDNKIGKIIVLINTSNALQVDFLKDPAFDVDACLWIGGLGIRGTNAVADILVGDVNPSGSLADTYAYDNYSSPAMHNFLATQYTNWEGNVPGEAKSYMIYQEGIYVGYKYYETRYEDYVMGKANVGEFNYNDDVAFTFGYGESYSEFEYTDFNVNYNAETDQYEVSVKVHNVSKVPGKETVQIYAQSPYTQYDIDNKIEKSSVALVGFGKTDIIPGNSHTTLKINVDRRDLASYDAYGYGTYILEAGDYYLTAATDAHNAVNNILTAKKLTPANTDNRMDAEGNGNLVYTWNESELDLTYSESLSDVKIENQLSDADLTLYSETKAQLGDFKYLSRNDWTGTWPTKILQLSLTEKMMRELQNLRYDPSAYETVEMPKLGQKHGMKLLEMKGADYDDPRWNTLLEQITFDELVTMIGDSFHWRMPVESVNAPGPRDENGPQGLTASLFGSSDQEGMKATAFTSEDVMAATFNVDLIYQVGRMIGNNCLGANVACLYGPGANTHRTPYGGRNFEYYSEDGFLAGEMGGAEVGGIQSRGVDVVMKHFALNDSEQDRLGQAAWINEQTAREIYLKAFQKALEEAGGNGVMTAYTRWGTCWSGAHKGLMTNIMRGEWNNQGMSITDNVLVQYTNGVDAVLAGGVSTFDAMLWYVTEQLPKYENDPVVVSAMVNAAHHNLYALVNSSGMNGVGPNTIVTRAEPLILIQIANGAATIFTVLAVLGYLFWIVGSIKIRNEKKAYKEAKNELKTAKKSK